MSCFMGYNPLVAKEVKITTWIKEFDGDSPVYPSFPNEGDCFVVFATDEDALTHNALSKKTYTNGDWADAEGGGGGDFSTAEVTLEMPLNLFTTVGNIVYIEGGVVQSIMYYDDFEYPHTFTVPLGENGCSLYREVTEFDTCTGDVSYDENNHCYVITGDCSISLADPPEPDDGGGGDH